MWTKEESVDRDNDTGSGRSVGRGQELGPESANLGEESGPKRSVWIKEECVDRDNDSGSGRSVGRGQKGGKESVDR